MSGSVLIVGTGLIGTSIGLALRGSREVALTDTDPEHLRTAASRGAGAPWDGQQVELVVVAVPPNRTATALANLQRQMPLAVFTHVASVQASVADDPAMQAVDLSRVCGGHPLAGRESSGPDAAEADLFLGRPWLLCPSEATSPDSTDLVRSLAVECGAEPVLMSAAEHDRAVALVSHLPQVAASALAARLLSSTETDIAVSGPGLQDTTRIAASDPELWSAILRSNAQHVAPLVTELAADLSRLAEVLHAVAADPSSELSVVTDLLQRGRQGRALVPIKRGDHERDFTRLSVSVPDAPGQLAAVFVCAARASVNIEDVRVEHLPGRPTGVLELLVHAGERDRLAQALAADGFTVLAGD